MFKFKNVAERRAIVEEAIYPQHTGRVRFQGSWWSARCQRPITLLPGDVVYVVGNQGIILLVDSEFASEPNSSPAQKPIGKSDLHHPLIPQPTEHTHAIEQPCR